MSVCPDLIIKNNLLLNLNDFLIDFEQNFLHPLKFSDIDKQSFKKILRAASSPFSIQKFIFINGKFLKIGESFDLDFDCIDEILRNHDLLRVENELNVGSNLTH